MTAPRDLIGIVAPEGPDVFGDWNLALSAAPVAIRIEPGAVIAAPVVVHVHTDADGLAWFPRLVVVAGRTSQATVIEHHTGGDAPALICPLTELSLGDGAHLGHLTVQELGDAAWQLVNHCSDVGRDANLRIGHVAMGGAYARARIGTDMTGRGGHSEIDAVYFGRGTSTLDFRTFQTHVAPHTTSDLLFKGAVDDHARVVYTGLIRIEADAFHVVAEQTNRNLKLSPYAWAESVPNLEIENNDVQCSHASSTGPSTPTSASTSRAVACRPTWPRHSWCGASSTRSSMRCRRSRSLRRCVGESMNWYPRQGRHERSSRGPHRGAVPAR